MCTVESDVVVRWCAGGITEPVVESVQVAEDLVGCVRGGVSYFFTTINFEQMKTEYL